MGAHGVCPCQPPLPPPCLQAALGAWRLQFDSTARRELSPPTHAGLEQRRVLTHPASPNNSSQGQLRDSLRLAETLLPFCQSLLYFLQGHLDLCQELPWLLFSLQVLHPTLGRTKLWWVGECGVGGKI